MTIYLFYRTISEPFTSRKRTYYWQAAPVLSPKRYYGRDQIHFTCRYLPNPEYCFYLGIGFSKSLGYPTLLCLNKLSIQLKTTSFLMSKKFHLSHFKAFSRIFLLHLTSA